MFPAFAPSVPLRALAAARAPARACQALSSRAAAGDRGGGLRGFGGFSSGGGRGLLAATPFPLSAAVAATTNNMTGPPRASIPTRTPTAATRQAPAQALAPDSRPPAGAPLKMLYDGECPLCLREVAALRARAAAFETSPLAFVDVAAPDYDPAAHAGVTFEDAMGRIHAVMPGGEVVVGVDVFRRVYDALGLGWVYGWTRLPVLGHVASTVYDLWATHRLTITGRPTLAEIVAMREKADNVDDGSCDEDGCSVEGRL